MPGTAFNSANWSGFDEAVVTNPSSALTDFTLLIDVSTLSASWKAAVQSDGGDIRVTKGDGTTELPYDLIAWAYNSGAPTGTLRVKWTGSLSSSGTQTVRVWAGYTAGTAAAYDASETYGRHNAYDADWVLYYPFEEASGLFLDRTANAIDTTVVTGGQGGTGAVGSCFDVGGVQRATVEGAALLHDLGPVTVCAWAEAEHGANMQARRVFDKSGGGDLAGFQFMGYGAFHTNGMQFNVQHATTNAYARTATNFWTGDIGKEWHHFAATWDGAAAPSMFVDGVDDTDPVSNTAPSGTRTSDTLSTPYVGNSIFSNRDWWGKIDDLQIHSAERAAAWLAEEHAQTVDQAAFWGAWVWSAVSSAVTRAFGGAGWPAPGSGTRAMAF